MSRRPTPAVVRHRLAGERGASLAMVAISMTVLLGMASLVVDIANGWLVRQRLVKATDAAALAAAQDYASGNDAIACGTAAAYLADNAPSATLDPSCPVVESYSTGYQSRLTVTATDEAETFFAGAVGLGDFDVDSTTSAVLGPPEAVTGLRPMALCLAAAPELQDAITNESAIESVTISYTKDDPDDCGESASNWFVLNYESGLLGWLLDDLFQNGYDDPVGYGQIDADVCYHPYFPHAWLGGCGNWWSFVSLLADLDADNTWMWVPVYDDVYDKTLHGGGWWERMNIVGFVRVQVLDFDLGLSWPYVDPYLRLRIEPGLITGTCCGGPSGAAGNRVIAMCGVEPGLFDACEP